MPQSQQCQSIWFEDLQINGIFINQLPEDQRISFNKWLHGQTITTIHRQPFAYAADYERWYKSWIKNEIAEVVD